MTTVIPAPAYVLARGAWVPALVIWHADGRFTRLEVAPCGNYAGGAGGELAAAPRMTPPPTQAGAPLILVVDDLDDARFMYSLYLTTHGFRVVEAANGEEAIRLAREHRPALVLMDLGLPVMDGWEATRRIKADRRTRGVPVLALSGHAFPDSMKRAKAAGADAFLVKPCLPAIVLAKIKEMLGRSQ